MHQEGAKLVFGDCVLDQRLLELRHVGRVVPLQPKPLQVLRYLIEHRSRVVSKQELLRALWPDVRVSDSAVWSALRDIRNALRDAKSEAAISIQRGRGYRFTGAVVEAHGAARCSSAASASPFVGRAEELERLSGAWRRAVAGASQVVWIEGEAGIGKSRLLEEFAARVSASGARVIEGRCVPGSSRSTHDLFAQALAPLGARCDADTRAPREDELPEAHARILERVHEWSLESPLLIRLEDLQWADARTLTLVLRLARASSRSRTLIAASYASADLDAVHPLMDLRAALALDCDFCELRLEGVAHAEAVRLVDALAGQELSEMTRRRLVDAGEGHPFILRELVDAALEQRPERGALPVLPTRVSCWFEIRIARLSRAARNLLLAGACVEGSFSFDEARRAAGMPQETALDALDEAIAAGLIRSDADPDRYTFTHGLLRSFVQMQASPARRGYLSARLAAPGALRTRVQR